MLYAVTRPVFVEQPFTVKAPWYALPQAPNATVAYTLPCAAGTFTLTGEAVSFAQGTGTADYVLLCNSGTFNLLGAPSSSDLQMDLAFGSFGLSGQAVTLTAGVPLSAVVCSGGTFDSLTPMPGLML